MKDAQRPRHGGQSKYHAHDEQRYGEEPACNGEVGYGSGARKADQRAIDASLPCDRVPEGEGEDSKGSDRERDKIPDSESKRKSDPYCGDAQETVNRDGHQLALCAGPIDKEGKYPLARRAPPNVILNYHSQFAVTFRVIETRPHDVIIGMFPCGDLPSPQKMFAVDAIAVLNTQHEQFNNCRMSRAPPLNDGIQNDAVIPGADDRSQWTAEARSSAPDCAK